MQITQIISPGLQDDLDNYKFLRDLCTSFHRADLPTGFAWSVVHVSLVGGGMQGVVMRVLG